MAASVELTLGGVFGFRGHSAEVYLTMEEAIRRLRSKTNKPQSRNNQFIPGIDYVSEVERSARFLLVRYLEGYKSVQKTIVEEEDQHFVAKRIWVSVPIHKHLIDGVLFAKGAIQDRWFLVQGEEVGEAFGRLNRYLRAVGGEVSLSSYASPQQEALAQDILVTLYFQDLYGGRIRGIKIAGKRYPVLGTRVRYSGDWDLRRSEYADEINERLRAGEKVESITVVPSRASVPASVGREVPTFTIRSDLRISSRSKIRDKTVWAAIAIAKLLEEHNRNLIQEVFEEERRLRLRSVVSLEKFL